MRTSALAAAILILPVLLFPGQSRAGQHVTIAIDIGHSVESKGALSARNRPEYVFNRRMAAVVLRELKKDARFRPFIINPDGSDISLQERAGIVNAAKSDILISIHHDSVQQEFLSDWIYRGMPARFCDAYRGYSLFISEKNGRPKASRRLAIVAGRELKKAGFLPSAHHAALLKGEGKQPVDSATGVYRYDGLVVLKEAKCSAVLLECGIIRNRSEETLLRSRAYQARMARTIRQALVDFLKDRKHASR